MQTKTYTSEQARERIAELRGWTHLRKSVFTSNRLLGTSPTVNETDVVRDWLNRIEHAIELVDVMRKKRMVVLTMADFDSGNTMDECALQDDAAFEDKTICRAICRAFIYLETGEVVEISD